MPGLCFKSLWVSNPPDWSAYAGGDAVPFNLRVAAYMAGLIPSPEHHARP